MKPPIFSAIMAISFIVIGFTLSNMWPIIQFVYSWTFDSLSNALSAIFFVCAWICLFALFSTLKVEDGKHGTQTT